MFSVSESVIQSPGEKTSFASYAISSDGNFILSGSAIRPEVVLRSCSFATKIILSKTRRDLGVSAVAVSISPHLIGAALSSSNSFCVLCVFECFGNPGNSFDWSLLREFEISGDDIDECNSNAYNFTSVSSDLFVFSEYGESNKWFGFVNGSVVRVGNVLGEKITQLEGHRGSVKAILFFQLNESVDCLISASEDRSFKVWNLSNFSCIYNSPILSAHSILSISLSPSYTTLTDRRILVLGTDDAMIHLHEIRSSKVSAASEHVSIKLEVRALKILKVENIFNSIERKISKNSVLSAPPEKISSLPKWKQSQKYSCENNESLDCMTSSSLSCTFLIHFKLKLCKHDYAKDDPLKTPSFILISTQTKFCVVDAKSFDTLFTHTLNEAGFSQIVCSSGQNCSTDSLQFEFLVEQRLTGKLSLYSLSSCADRNGSAAIVKNNWASFSSSQANSSTSENIDFFKLEEKFTAPDVNPSPVELTDIVTKSVGKADINSGSGIWADRVCDGIIAQLAALEIRSLNDIKERRNSLIKVAGTAQANDQRFCIYTLPKSIAIGILNIADERILPSQSTTSFHVESDIWEIEKQKNTVNETVGSDNNIKNGNNSTKHDKIKMNQPLTFRKTIKSSGYTQEPLSKKMFKLPKISSERAATSSASIILLNKILATKNSWLSNDTELPLYDSKKVISSLKTFQHPSPAICVRFNENDSAIAVGCSQKSAFVHQIGAASTTKAFYGHDSAVQYVYWGSNEMSDTFLTTAIDGSCRLWTTASSDPLISFGLKKSAIIPKESNALSQPIKTIKLATIQSSKHFSSMAALTSKPTQAQQQTPLHQAQFFFHNKFILAFSKRQLLLHTHKIASRRRHSSTITKSSEIRPALNYNTITPYRHAVASPTFAATVTAFDAPNRFSSHIAIVSTADTVLHVVDLYRGGISLSSASICNNVHTIVCPSEQENPHLFVTAACHDGIRVWDLRTFSSTGGGAVVQLLGHVNRFAKVQCAMSPCGKYVATGSEDKQAYVYDLRNAAGGVLCKLRDGITDIVYGVDFCRAKSVVAVAARDGKCLLYRL
ncbi:WD repeat-containing protein 27 [Physocladia obscura]|uniref:WD repeat-containing protein 27 n=1 Tax=Physocladia obscura TaxID=109957 RepID=A0AAD5T3K2_9FUNG|nr:WD repeat-containing protein 27 [Physocladia obscura]